MTQWHCFKFPGFLCVLVFSLICKCSVVKTSFLEEWTILICMILTPGTFPIGQLHNIYICIPEHSFSWKVMWPCLFPPGNSLAQGPPMNANRISWMVAALDGCGQQQFYIIYFVIGMATSQHDTNTWGSSPPKALLPVPLSDRMTQHVCTWKAMAIHE